MWKISGLFVYVKMHVSYHKSGGYLMHFNIYKKPDKWYSNHGGVSLGAVGR
jgi:hypothetical protein